MRPEFSPPRHDPNGLCAANLWFGEAGDEGDEMALAVCVLFLEDGLQLVARSRMGDAKTIGDGVERFLAHQPIREPRLRGCEAEDADEVGGQGSRPRVEIGEDDETLNERKALTDRVREPGGIGDDRAAALSR